MRNSIISCVVAVVAACGADVGEHVDNDRCACQDATLNPAQESEDFGTRASALYGRRSAFWGPVGTYAMPLFRTDIDVCWENPESTTIGSTAQARAAWRDARRRAVEVSWARHARINFYGWGTCQPGATGLRILLCNSGDRRCPLLPASQANGNYPELDGRVNGILMNPAGSPRVLVHEFGHALGFYHAEERFNTSANIGTTSCNPAQSGWTNDSPVTYGAYDEASIMSRCISPPSEPWLTTRDVGGIQRSYGRRLTGSLVTPRAKCASAHAAAGAGDNAFLWDCDEYADDQEFNDITTYSTNDTWNLRLGDTSLCLAKASYVSGSPVELATCSQSSSYDDWRLQQMSMVGFGGLCLDLEAGNTSPGTKIQMWECGALGGANQKWTRTRNGLLKFSGTSMCARLNPSTNRLRLASCNAGDSNQVFLFGSQKIMTSTYPFKCLDVVGPSDADFAKNGSGAIGNPSNGNVIQAHACNTSLNQRWHLSGAIRSGGNSSQCLSRASDASGSWLTIESCSGSDGTQNWDYYF
ncbi:MAG: ricin-type beta-trefoil lectin domain protein [Deltaproteobacteria bacterium]